MKLLSWLAAPLKCKLGFHEDALSIGEETGNLRLRCLRCLRATPGWTIDKKHYNEKVQSKHKA